MGTVKIDKLINTYKSGKRLAVATIKILWLPILSIMCVASLHDVLNELLLVPLWRAAKLSEGISLSLTTLAICFALMFLGWKNYAMKYSRQHLCWYAFACMAYAYFGVLDTWTYISCFGILPCWLCLLLAYPVGVLFHIGVLFFRSRIQQKKDGQERGALPLIIVDDYPIDDVNEDILGYNGYAERIVKTIMQEKPYYRMRDDRNAKNRRKWSGRKNEYYVMSTGFKALGLPWYYQLYALRPLIIGMLPGWLYDWLHKRR